MDRVEQSDRLARLVGLKAPDAVESEVGVTSEERRPFRARFLNAVLTEVALARLDQRVDFLGGPGPC